MAEIWKPQPIEVYREWMRKILAEAEVTAWENVFLRDIDMRLQTGQQLTQAQAEKLEQIYADKTK